LILAIAGVVALTYWARVDPVLKLLASTAPVWSLLAFVLFYYMGETVARADYRDHRESGFQHYHWVRVWTIPDQIGAPAKLQTMQQGLAADNYRLLLQMVRSLYLSQPNQDGGDPNPPDTARSDPGPAADTHQSWRALIRSCNRKFITTSFC